MLCYCEHIIRIVVHTYNYNYMQCHACMRMHALCARFMHARAYDDDGFRVCMHVMHDPSDHVMHDPFYIFHLQLSVDRWLWIDPYSLHAEHYVRIGWRSALYLS